MALGVRDAMPKLNVIEIPMADGGEGTVEALLATKHGEWVGATVTGPSGDAVDAEYGLIDHGRTAVIEMAAASGLALVHESERNALTATTRGTGELIRDALDRDVKHILVGLGGSATTDGGAGMAAALGVKLLDAEGNDLPDGGEGLSALHTIDIGDVHPGLRRCKIEAACDVRNPLIGPNGTAHIYGPQKGASPKMVQSLDKALAHYARCIKEQLGFTVSDVEGAGAAGGTAAGLLVFTQAVLRPGFDMVADACGLEGAIANAALVFTGEGNMDGQSAHGKTPVGVGQLAARYDVPCLAIVGTKSFGWEISQDAGSLEYIYALDAAAQKASGKTIDSIADAPALIQAAAAHLIRRWHQAPA
jgi:glycerate kinase